MNSMFLRVSGSAVIVTVESNLDLRRRFSLETFPAAARAMGELIPDILRQPQMPHIYHVLKRTHLRH
ncbi:hypothetical protein [Caulobacter segnis]